METEDYFGMNEKLDGKQHFIINHYFDPLPFLSLDKQVQRDLMASNYKNRVIQFMNTMTTKPVVQYDKIVEQKRLNAK